MNTNTRPESMALATAPQQAAPATISSNDLMLSDTKMDRIIRVAELMATGRSTVPKHLQGNVGDCMAVTMLATRWNMDPFAVAQKTHLINGALGYESQLIAARINSSGVVSDRFSFEWFGDWNKIVGKFKTVESRNKTDDDGKPKKFIVPDWDQKDEQGLGVRVSGTIRGESVPRVLELLMTQARTRNSTLWTEDPKQQLAYLAQKRWARLYAPDVILGAYDPEELLQAAPRDMGTAEEVSLWTKEQETAGDEAAAKGTAAYAAFWKGLASDVQTKLVGTKEHKHFKDQAQRADAARTVDVPTPTPTPAPAPAADKATGEVFTTVADVRSKLESAKTEDALYVAMDWASAIPQPEQDAARADLEALFNQRLAAIRGE